MKSFSRHSLIIFAIFSSAFITLYFLRFVQVLGVRQIILQRKEINYKFTSFSLSYIKGGKNWVDAPDVRIQLPLDETIMPGDRLEVVGNVDQSVRPISSSPILLTSRQIRHIKPRDALGINSVYRLLKLLEGTPRELQNRLSGFLEREQAVFLGGLVFGGTEGLSKGVIEDLKNTGLSHIAAASGFNVSILIVFSLAVFTRILNRRIAALVSLVFVFAYSVMAGFSPPITRAGIMGGLYLCSLIMGRQYSVLRSLLGAGMLMAIHQPFVVMSPSFLLSVGATFGLVLSDRMLPGRVFPDSLPGRILSVLEESFRSSISVLVLTTPIIIAVFGSFSLVAPLANSFLLWMVAPLTLLGLFFMPLCLLLPGVANLLALPFSFVLEVFLRSVHAFAGLPGASVMVSAPKWWGIFGWYLCLIIYLAGKWHSTSDTASDSAQ